jgi:hypothetical protein
MQQQCDNKNNKFRKSNLTDLNEKQREYLRHEISTYNFTDFTLNEAEALPSMNSHAEEIEFDRIFMNFPTYKRPYEYLRLLTLISR